MVKVRRRSRLSLEAQKALLVQFVAGTPARTATELTGVNRNSATLFYCTLHELIVARLAEESTFIEGEIEVDESYFGR
jgi:transposase